jgi:hypothetical protein
MLCSLCPYAFIYLQVLRIFSLFSQSSGASYANTPAVSAAEAVALP